MTADQKRRVIEAIAETQRFIDTEEKRDPSLRPEGIQKHLEFCRAHVVKLQGMLKQD